MDEFPGNSRRVLKPSEKTEEAPPTPDKKIERVVEGPVIRRKKPLGKRFMETFVGGDARGVLGYILMDVLLPAAKDTIADAVSQGIERMLFGEARSSSRRTGYRPGQSVANYVRYDRYNQPNVSSRREDPRRTARTAKPKHNFDDLVLATRVEANEVLERLYDLLSRYEFVSVSDLYELLGESDNANYTDQKWGWTDLRGADIIRVREGYLLSLPNPEPLD